VEETARRADGINIAADGKTFLRLHGMAANAEFARMVPDTSKIDAFGEHAMKRDAKHIRTPMLQQASHAIDVKSRKSGGTHANCNIQVFCRQLTLTNLHSVVREHKDKITQALDGANDNRGRGAFKTTMANMCGEKSLMHGTMIEGGGWEDAKKYLVSLDLFHALEWLYSGRDLEGLISRLSKKRAVERGPLRAAARARTNIIKALELKAKQAADAAKQAVVEEARCASEASLLRTAEARSRKSQAKKAADALNVTAREAQQTFKQAKRRRDLAGWEGPAGPSAPQAAAADSAAAGADSAPHAAPVAAPAPAAADSVAGAPVSLGAPAPANGSSRFQLDTSRPVMKCPEEMERLERCKIYELRLRASCGLF